MEDVFTKTFLEDRWKSDESRSGPSSTLGRTQNLRRQLPELLRQFDVRRMFDAPCGDLNWMKLLIEQGTFSYLGGDIVAPMINQHKKDYENSENVEFLHIDLTSDRFPKADLMFCRDCLFHLSYEDTLKVLKNFVASDIPWLMTTTHFNHGQIVNSDIITGSWRWMDLFEAPYNFPRNPFARITDGGGDREMCLWSREQIVGVVNNWKV